MDRISVSRFSSPFSKSAAVAALLLPVWILPAAAVLLHSALLYVSAFIYPTIAFWILLSFSRKWREAGASGTRIGTAWFIFALFCLTFAGLFHRPSGNQLLPPIFSSAYMSFWLSLVLGILNHEN